MAKYISQPVDMIQRNFYSQTRVLWFSNTIELMRTLADVRVAVVATPWLYYIHGQLYSVSCPFLAICHHVRFETYPDVGHRLYLFSRAAEP